MLHIFFFFNDTATTEIYTLSLHDALPILIAGAKYQDGVIGIIRHEQFLARFMKRHLRRPIDRKSTRLNSSHVRISYAVFCLKKKKKHPSNFSNNDKKNKHGQSRHRYNLAT